MNQQKKLACSENDVPATPGEEMMAAERVVNEALDFAAKIIALENGPWHGQSRQAGRRALGKALAAAGQLCSTIPRCLKSSDDDATALAWSLKKAIAHALDASEYSGCIASLVGHKIDRARRLAKIFATPFNYDLAATDQDGVTVLTHAGADWIARPDRNQIFDTLQNAVDILKKSDGAVETEKEKDALFNLRAVTKHLDCINNRL